MDNALVHKYANFVPMPEHGKQIYYITNFLSALPITEIETIS